MRLFKYRTRYQRAMAEALALISAWNRERGEAR